EVVITALTGCVIGIPIGIVGAFLVGAWAMVPTMMFLLGGIFLWFGGTIMRRLRRGRPPELLYRSLQWRFSSLGIQMSSEDLITRSSVYRCQRDRTTT
ncbi:TIGR03750 family conjugal transfer protein, partial [Halomonas sp. THAF12]|uniref:TIGR03750 family conjugal transfer protein n=1 Tax=Halomonas sp. B23F22_10 TaxID=3459515 RepID=UPI00373ED8BD